ncbi:MAG: hypothetical protein KDC87_14185 [Planctomycetes bacterium]|nr:hypothetical protein [Planctomycetota bacterium]MCB9871326.1 hypothetical protein [Planctomycetota bacterium]MCB9888581.1 hypothetical protein [Planctomycetota bacterium]
MNLPPKITVEPNPAPEGGSVTVTGPPGSKVYVNVPGKPPATTVVLDDKGKARVDVPVGGGEEFEVSDCKFPDPSEVVVDVVGSVRQAAQKPPK